jgi:hypothetical protein
MTETWWFADREIITLRNTRCLLFWGTKQSFPTTCVDKRGHLLSLLRHTQQSRHTRSGVFPLNRHLDSSLVVMSELLSDEQLVEPGFSNTGSSHYFTTHDSQILGANTGSVQPCPTPPTSSAHNHILFLSNDFNIILSTMPVSHVICYTVIFQLNVCVHSSYLPYVLQSLPTGST